MLIPLITIKICLKITKTNSNNFSLGIIKQVGVLGGGQAKEWKISNKIFIYTNIWIDIVKFACRTLKTSTRDKCRSFLHLSWQEIESKHEVRWRLLSDANETNTGDKNMRWSNKSVFFSSWQIKLTIVLSNNHYCFILTWIFLKFFFELQGQRSFLRSSHNISLNKLNFAMSCYFWEVQCFGFIWSNMFVP